MADLRRVLRRKRAASSTVDVLVDVVAEFGTAVGDAVGKDYNFANSRAEKFLKGYMTQRVGMINATTRADLNRALKSDHPREAVRQVFRHAKEHRARLIAQTEVVRTSNFAAIDAGKWVKLLDRKRWATQQDAAVRHEHRGLHSQTVPWNGMFTSPSGYRGPGPGSMEGGPAMNVACRCAAVPVAASKVQPGFPDDPVQLYDNLREPFIEQLEAQWRAVFREQERTALAELEL